VIAAPRKPDLRIVCDCCPEVATRKGGEWPYYLCGECAGLQEEKIEKRRRVKYGIT
jgi:hypothetical protein